MGNPMHHLALKSHKRAKHSQYLPETIKRFQMDSISTHNRQSSKRVSKQQGILHISERDVFQNEGQNNDTLV